MMTQFIGASLPQTQMPDLVTHMILHPLTVNKNLHYSGKLLRENTFVNW